MGKKGKKKGKKNNSYKTYTKKQTERFQEKQRKKADLKEIIKKKKHTRKQWRTERDKKQLNFMDYATIAVESPYADSFQLKQVSDQKMECIFGETICHQVGQKIQIHGIRLDGNKVSAKVTLTRHHCQPQSVIGTITSIVPPSAEDVVFDGYNISQDETGLEIFIPYHFQPYILRV
jgi:hypothetical protein